MTAIDKELTLKALTTFRDRQMGCKLTDYEQGLVDGLGYCIKYIEKFAPEASQMAQIAFTFGDEQLFKKGG